MISGVVNALLEATIRVSVQNASGQEHDIEGLVDTGFNGSLTLPPALIAKLRLRWYTRSSITLANGSKDEVDVYAATVIWDGGSRRILVEATDAEPLIGMQLMHRHIIRIEAIDGGGVEIEPLN
ncbi:MAG: clan AA aspartic protease [Pirellulales bacterium]